MPAVIILIIGAGAIWLGYRGLKQVAQHVTEELKAAERELRLREQAGIRLERDPATGVYKPSYPADGTAH